MRLFIRAAENGDTLGPRVHSGGTRRPADGGGANDNLEVTDLRALIGIVEAHQQGHRLLEFALLVAAGLVVEA